MPNSLATKVSRLSSADDRLPLKALGLRGDDPAQPADAQQLLQFVEEVEGILRSEVDSWSQFTARPTQDGDQPKAQP